MLEQTLRNAGIESAEAEARWMLEHLLSREVVLTQPQRELTRPEFEMLTAWLERRVSREPLQHILGVAPFYGLELAVNSHVLIPRPETERLVELVLETINPIKNPKILDVGTGSGAIALAIKHEHPDARILATDVSGKALEIAKQNAKKYDLELIFLESNLLEHPDAQTFAKTCDVLVANLPYLPLNDKKTVSTEVLHDPDLALYAGTDGLELFRRLEEEAFEILPAKTLCFFELDPRNVETAFELCQRWRRREVLEDWVERKRFLKLGK